MKIKALINIEAHFEYSGKSETVAKEKLRDDLETLFNHLTSSSAFHGESPLRLETWGDVTKIEVSDDR